MLFEVGKEKGENGKIAQIFLLPFGISLQEGNRHILKEYWQAEYFEVFSPNILAIFGKKFCFSI